MSESMYTIVQTAKLDDVNPEAYLRGTLAKIVEGRPINEVDALLPWIWVARRNEGREAA